ncbi:MAG: ABC transporter substrate-binding protein [Thermomicrobiales bacterium]|nr:ABC transporter substrate-binding protein [Thermomicrobiales bacterium]
MAKASRRAGAAGRRQVLASMAALAGAAVSARFASAQDATPTSGEWTFTDVLGNTVTLPERPQRIAAAINMAASLWDYGIEVPTIFGWTATNYPAGDHVSWGNIDVEAVEVVSNVAGDVEVEKLLAAQPDLIVTWSWDRDAPMDSLVAILPEQLEQVAGIAPILVLTQGDANDVELERIEALAEALGANLDSAEIVAQREAYEAKKAELRQVAEEKHDLSVLFANFGDSDRIWVAGPDYVADLGQVRDLGVNLANEGSPSAISYWEELSLEQALKYPSDVIYIDQYSPWKTLEDLQAEPTVNQHPAVKAGQVGPWPRDLPLNYQGLTTFLESVLEPLRDAEKVS